MPPRFSIREAINTGEATGNTVTATSDVHAHLWMRWTSITPRIHKIPVLRRGLWLNDDVRFCFDVYQDIEQNEAGDTLTHTFTISPCVSGRHFYYYLWGYIGGIISPSTTSVMEYHHGIQCPGILVTTLDARVDNRTIRANHALWPNTHDAAAAPIGPWHAAPLFRLVALASQTATYWCARVYLIFDTSEIPTGSTIVAATLLPYIQLKTKSSSAAQPYIYVTLGIQNTPVITTDYGDQLPLTTIGGQVHLDDCVPGDVAAIELNASGRSWIDPDGLTRLCLRQQMDVTDTPPPLGENSIAFSSAQDVYWKRPKLTIQYSPP